MVLPRPSLERPVSELAWDAAVALSTSRALEVEVIIPVPARAARKLAVRARAQGPLADWPEGLEETLAGLTPRPQIVHYPPIPFRALEAAAATVAAHLVGRRRALRPALLFGAVLDEAGFVAAEAARALGASTLVSAHGIDVAAKSRRTRSTLAHATRVLAASPALKAGLGLLGRSSELFPAAADAIRFPLLPPAPDTSPLALYVGPKTRARGLVSLIEALERCAVPGLRLRVIGNSAPDLDLPVLVHSLGLEGKVELFGELSHAALAPHFAEAKLVVIPAPTEGLPTAAIEGLLSGRPVVAVDSPGTREVVDSSVGALVAPEDPTALAHGIQQVLAGQYEPAALRRRALPYTWQEAGPKLLAHTLELIGRSEAEEPA